MMRSPSVSSAKVTSVAFVSVVSPGASFLYVVFSVVETATTEPASVLIVTCFVAASMVFTSPIACLAAIDGSVWAATEVAKESVISDMAVKASALVICPFLLLNTTGYDFMEISSIQRLHGFPANPITRSEGQANTNDQNGHRQKRPNVRK